MTYSQCNRCKGLLLAEDHACRICRRPVERGEEDVAEHGAASQAPAAASALRTLTPAFAPSSLAPPAPRRRRARSRSFVGAPGVPPAPRSTARRPATDPALGVRGLTKIYGEGALAVAAVQGVTFDVAPGEVVLVMGPSGSGKTTLLLMLGAMLRPTAGTVVIGGTDLASTPERRLPQLRASRLGFVFQDFNLLSALGALENVELACNLAGVSGRRARSRSAELLERVGLARRMDARPHQLSGGEKQRVAIARALANDPPLLLADEPTANLDSGNGREIASLLRKLADEDGRTSLIVTHDDRLTAIADRVLWLEDGMLAARGR